MYTYVVINVPVDNAGVFADTVVIMVKMKHYFRNENKVNGNK